MIHKANIKVYFKNASILRAICRTIRLSDKVRACVAWCTNPRILDALEERDSEIIMTRAKCNRWKRAIKVKYMGSGRGKNKVLLHHKFAVCFRKGKPHTIITGSYNWTKSASRHYENITIIEDPDIAEGFYEEFCRLRKL
tara:strand:- start:346 stop:765 length:420 start_codon:yes stop_codon:yes gene_type:complete